MPKGRKPVDGRDPGRMVKPEHGNSACRGTSEMLMEGSSKVRDYTAFFVSGDQYTGSWRDGKKHGKGTYRWKKTGLIYEGDWADDLRDGFGTMSIQMKNGMFRKQYVGAWSGGKKHGYGTHFYSEEVRYEGEWSCGKREGWGRMIYADCSIYEGQWKNDKPNGIGMTVYANGCRHEGQYVDGKKEGHGKFYHTDRGQLFEGLWVSDLPRCGTIVDHDRENVPDATLYPLPRLELTDADKVLQGAILSYLPQPKDTDDDNDNDVL